MKQTFVIISMAATLLTSCSSYTPKEYASFEDYPVRTDDLSEMVYTPSATTFKLWAPTAEAVQVCLYKEGKDGSPYKTLNLKPAEEGTWAGEITQDLDKQFFTFKVKIHGQWLAETPGINAKAVGVNGQRAAIINLDSTDPEGWAQDKSPALASSANVMIYEMHHRDFSVSTTSGIAHPGKYLALTEKGTTNENGDATGIDHLKDLGITHVHILPSYDYASVNETTLDTNDYNWGYDPLNYNVPDGSYSTDPYNPATRIKEFKEMVQALHQAGIRVVLDVVYNHTFNIEDSNFQRTVPGYFYRLRPDSTYANGSGCNNETASERAMMRRYMMESVRYWIQEYHLDGFRFDLMGIHDIKTMNDIRKMVSAIDPSIIIYGEGWAAEAPQLPQSQLAMKANTNDMPGIAAFSDELRDALRGPFNDDTKGAFLAGLPGNEESIKFGIIGAIEHPQVDYSKVNYSKAPWAAEPTQMISYVSCHDDLCLVDRLKSSIPGIQKDELIRLDKLAQTAVFTSQGIPFMQAGEEVLRDKQGVHNSFDSPDSINAIDWNRKTQYKDVFNYYQGLISMRKNHPAFHLGQADAVRQHVEFLPVKNTNVVAFCIKGNPNGDSWKDITVLLNANKQAVNVNIPQGVYTVVCRDGKINENGLGSISGGSVKVAVQSALILHR